MAMYDYLKVEIQQGTRPRQILKAMLGWAHGKKGARQWRRYLSEPAQMARLDAEVLLEAWQQLQQDQTID